MNGAESVIKMAAESGIDTCFANPGTTELQLVSAIDKIGGIRPVLCLAEGVVAGAVDGFGRMKERPALSLLHLGAGLANGLAYFHNARRAATPTVNIVGGHASWHVKADAPLTSDIEALGRTVSTWIRTSASANEMYSDTAEAIRQSSRGLATLIAPADFQASMVTLQATSSEPIKPQEVDEATARRVSQQIKDAGRQCLILLGGRALSARGLQAADAIRRGTECHLLHETFPARMERGPSLPIVGKLAYAPAVARAALKNYRLIVLAGAREPVSFFGYEGQPSSLVPAVARLETLAPAPQDSYFDSEGALETVVDCLSRPPNKHTSNFERPEVPSGRLTPETFALAVAAAQPERAIVVDESVTSGFSYSQASKHASAHTYLVPHLGGAIGHGLPLATGVAIAEPDRPVILLEADGSAMYTLQSLWTQARESLNVTTVICANRTYKILQLELGRDTAPVRDSAEDWLLTIDRPSLDWVAIARGLGVQASKVETAEALVTSLERATSQAGPHVIEAIL